MATGCRSSRRPAHGSTRCWSTRPVIRTRCSSPSSRASGVAHPQRSPPSTRCSPVARPATFPVVLTALRALAQPEVNLRGVNATTHLRRAADPGARRDRRGGRIHRRRRVFRARQPGQCDRRPGRAADHAARRRRQARASVTRPPTASRRSTRSARPRTLRSRRGSSSARSRGVDAPSAVTVHCGEGPHNVHDAEAAGEPGADPGQDRVSHDLARHEQRADQPGRVLHHPGTRARGEHGAAGHVTRGRLVLPLRPGPACRRRSSATTSRSSPGRGG